MDRYQKTVELMEQIHPILWELGDINWSELRANVKVITEILPGFVESARINLGERVTPARVLLIYERILEHLKTNQLKEN